MSGTNYPMNEVVISSESKGFETALWEYCVSIPALLHIILQVFCVYAASLCALILCFFSFKGRLWDLLLITIAFTVLIWPCAFFSFHVTSFPLRAMICHGTCYQLRAKIANGIRFRNLFLLFYFMGKWLQRYV